ncbi:MAG: rhomboid family intramembrane serine protease [Neomegalonema sp.]|nr:rhomboid family intramembrane serine protease [Neomegalonema sp.]
MIPIRDHNPSRKIPFVSWALIIINVGIFLSYFQLEQSELGAFFCTWGLVPIEVAKFAGYLTDGAATEALAKAASQYKCDALASGVQAYDGILTSMFLHGGWMHLIGNMLFLYIFGDNLEEYFGHIGFLAFYLLGGVAASAAHIAAGPESAIPTVGASGAIAAVMGGYLLLFPKARVDVLVLLGWFVNIITMRAWVMLLIWFGLQVAMGTIEFLKPKGTGGVAYWAHAGGFVFGLVIVGIGQLFVKRPARVDGHPDHPVVNYGRLRKGPWK